MFFKVIVFGAFCYLLKIYNFYHQHYITDFFYTQQYLFQLSTICPVRNLNSGPNSTQLQYAVILVKTTPLRKNPKTTAFAVACSTLA